MPSFAPRIARCVLAGLAVSLAGLGLAPGASAAGESISGTVTSAGGDPIAGVCVTAERAAGDVLTTTDGNGDYTVAVAPGDYTVRFDDCGTATLATQYYDNVGEQELADTVSVSPDQQVAGIHAVMQPLPPDDGAPETSIVSEPPATTNATSATFEFNSPDDPEASFECSFDGGSFGPCPSPMEYGQLGDGPHHFEVRAVDALNNRDPTPAGRDFVVDSAAPNGRIDLGPEGTIDYRDVSFTFSSDDDPNVHFLCRLDDRTEPCTSPQPYDGLDNGPHSFKVIAIDDNNNADQTPAIRSFYVNVGGPVDLDPPETAITDGPVGTIATTGTAFSFDSDETGSTYECSLDGGPFVDCQSPRIVTGLVNGDHTFSVRATDPAGNVDPDPATRTFTVDTTNDIAPPDTEISSGPTGSIGQSFATFSFSSTEGNSTFECSLDSAPFTACTSPRTYTGLIDGAHTFEVRARDATGNEDPSPATGTFTVDSNIEPDVDAPDTTIRTGPSAPIASRSASFTFDATEAGSSFECRMDLGTWRRCTSARAYTGLGDGSHTFQVRATDPAGNRDTSPDSRQFSVDATPPDTEILGGPHGQTIGSASAEYSFGSTETATTFECRLDANPWGSCENPHTLSGLTEGTHTFAVRATDAVGNFDGTPAISGFTVDATAPQTTIDSGPTGTVRQASQFEFHADEPGFFECRFDGGDWSFCSSPFDAPALGQGSHTFEVRGTDSAGNPDPTPAARTFAIDSAPPDTAIDGGPSGTITTNSASFAFSATESGSTFQCQLDSAGWAPCTSPQGYTGLSEGNHTFAVRASDGLNNQDISPATRQFTVDLPSTQPPPTNPPPPTGPDPACTDAQSRLTSAQRTLKRAKAKLRKARTAPAKRKAKAKVKSAKKKVGQAQTAVNSAC